MDAERRLQAPQRARPVLVCERLGIAGNLVAGDVVAEQQHGIGSKGVDLGNDAFDALDIHPRLAGVQVGDDGEHHGQAPRPARRRERVSGNRRAERLGQRIAAEADASGSGSAEALK